jgi:hypothetical protein
LYFLFRGWYVNGRDTIRVCTEYTVYHLCPTFKDLLHVNLNSILYATFYCMFVSWLLTAPFWRKLSVANSTLIGLYLPLRPKQFPVNYLASTARSEMEVTKTVLTKSKTFVSWLITHVDLFQILDF